MSSTAKATCWKSGRTRTAQPRTIAEILPECDTYLARRMGSQSRKKLMEEMGVTPVLVSETDPKTAVREYLKGVKRE